MSTFAEEDKAAIARSDSPHAPSGDGEGSRQATTTYATLSRYQSRVRWSQPIMRPRQSGCGKSVNR